ncbi:hypothetical protein CR513_33943, partial [Mucuna pruriens]
MNKTLIERVRCMLSKAKGFKHFWGETLYTVVHVINLTPTIAFNTKAFVHVLKDERSKLVMKTRQCNFIGYGCMILLRRNLSEDIDKVKRTTLEKDNSLFEIDPTRMLVHDLNTIENNGQNGERHDYLGDVFYVPSNNDAKEEQEIQSSTRYPSDEYETLIGGEEPECYQEASDKKGVDFNEIFSRVVKMSSIKIVLSSATIFDLEVE